MPNLTSGQRHAQLLRTLLDEAQLEACLRTMYDEVLVPLCKAPGNADHHGFLPQHLDLDYPATEWRFQGCLGFGGKFRLRSDLSARVDCYPEDETPSRRAVIEEANAALAEVRSRFMATVS